jgi:tRNA pseudouridine55 synthase
MTDHAVLSARTLDAMTAWLDEARTAGGVALIDKEETWTSFDCVAKLRGLTKIKKIGHAGTLDPLATGLLIVCVGKATKSITAFQDAPKAYEVTIKLGAVTPTDDRGSEETEIRPTDHLAVDDVLAALRTFIGTIEQIPPMFAAIRHEGRRQYDLARKGVDFTPRPRVVTITDITDVRVNLPFVSCTIHCSKGTYIRSIARDLGAALSCGGYVTQLRRTAIGDVSVNDAVTIDRIREALGSVVSV